MSAIQVFDFDGRAITAYSFRGRECWLSQDVGRVLGYDDASWRSSLREWRDELVARTDVDTLKGQDLREFLASANLALPKTTQLSVLFESGLNLVCIKTEKPLGRRLRRFLAETMLPRMRARSAEAEALRNELVELKLRLNPAPAATIWERETILGLCRLYGKPWDGLGRLPAFLKQPMGAIYRIVLGDVVYSELKRRNPDPHDGSLNYEFLTEAMHRLMVDDMRTVSAILTISVAKERFFSQLRHVYRRGPMQLDIGDARPALPSRKKAS